MKRHDVIIIPFRSMTDGKSRLSPVLAPTERFDLNRSMLDNVVDAAMNVHPKASVIMVSPDPDAIAYLAPHESSALRLLRQSPDAIGLNGALTQATNQAIREDARTVVVIPADLPLLRSQDIQNLLRRDAAVVIAPDRHREGTNGLLQRIDATRGEFVYHFGVGSFHAHIEEAHRLGLDAATAISLGTSFDLDTPVDLGDLQTLRSGTFDARRERVTHG